VSPAPEIRLLDIRDSDLSLDEVYAALRDDSAGGVALFVGTVRDHDSGKDVQGLGYSAHPTALAALGEVAEEVAKADGVVAVAAVHRTGDLAIGDIAVIVGVSCGHRGDAFAACRQLIDELKSRVPIWKHQVFTDGTEEWVGTP
jgi:molybdopterin synthase catalytic subunit